MPLAPNTPYDFFSSAPLVPGNAGLADIATTFNYGFKQLDAQLVLGFGATHGSVTNTVYWGESLMPTINPHLGSQALPYAIAFPTHAGGDDASVARLSILSGMLATADGALRLRAGWFDLAQTDRFVFIQPSLTNQNPQVGYQPAESLSNGPPSIQTGLPLHTVLPLHGADLVAKRGLATLELTHATLASLPGEEARMTGGSLVVDHAEGTRYSLDVVHVHSSGTPFITTVPFGSDPMFAAYPQGILPTSTLSGQQQTIIGASAAFHLIPTLDLDGTVEVGRAWYHAAPAARPGTEAPGGYYHAGLTRAVGRTTLEVDAYRMEPRYATMILPYGVAENQWSAAFAWPGQWLKSNYQLIDNTVLGVNRQGYRVRYNVDHGPLEVHTEYTDLRQIAVETRETATQAGFIDGFYLPQLPQAATLGRQRRSSIWIAYHPRPFDLALDIVDDTLYRPFLAAHPEDAVSYEVPQATLSLSRTFDTRSFAAGIGRYAIKGTFSEPIDAAQRFIFLGAQLRQSPSATILVSARRTISSGKTTFPLSSQPADFRSTSLVVEQRLNF